MGLTYMGCSAGAIGAADRSSRLLHGSSSLSSTRLRLVKSKQVVDKSKAESSTSDKSSTFTSLSEPDVVSIATAAAAAAAIAAAAAAADEVVSFGGLEPNCCTANRKLVSVCSHFWI